MCLGAPLSAVAAAAAPAGKLTLTVDTIDPAAFGFSDLSKLAVQEKPVEQQQLQLIPVPIAYPEPALATVSDAATAEGIHFAVDEELLGKTKLCKFFARGHCSRGKACTFAHGRKELKAKPNLYKTEMCYEFVNTGVCHHGSACKYAHRECDLRAPLPVAVPEPKPQSQARDRRSRTESRLTQRLAVMEQEAANLREQLRLLEQQTVSGKAGISSSCATTSQVSSSPTNTTSDLAWSFGTLSEAGDSECAEELEVDAQWVVKNSCLSLEPVKVAAASRKRSCSVPARLC